jgi:hypothetical protein
VLNKVNFAVHVKLSIALFVTIQEL